eukprot:SAG31_NODE_785_length_12089_cov_4.342936_3_plen_675_part_00
MLLGLITTFAQHSAVANGCAAAVEALLELGAQPSVRDDAGQTCYELAKDLGYAQVLVVFDQFAPASQPASEHPSESSEDDDTETDEEPGEPAKPEVNLLPPQQQQLLLSPQTGGSDPQPQQFLAELINLIDDTIGHGDVEKAKTAHEAVQQLLMTRNEDTRAAVQPHVDRLVTHIEQRDVQEAASRRAFELDHPELSSASVRVDMLPTSSLPAVMAASPIDVGNVDAHFHHDSNASEDLASPVDASRLAALAQLESDDSYCSDDEHHVSGQKGPVIKKSGPTFKLAQGGFQKCLMLPSVGDKVSPAAPSDTGAYKLDQVEIDLPADLADESTDEADDELFPGAHDAGRARDVVKAAEELRPGVMPTSKPPPPPVPQPQRTVDAKHLPNDHSFTYGQAAATAAYTRSSSEPARGSISSRRSTSAATRQAEAMRQLRARSPVPRRMSGDQPQNSSTPNDTLGFSPSPVGRSSAPQTVAAGLRARAERSLRPTSSEITTFADADQRTQTTKSITEERHEPSLLDHLSSNSINLRHARAAYIGRASSLLKEDPQTSPIRNDDETYSKNDGARDVPAVVRVESVEIRQLKEDVRQLKAEVDMLRQQNAQTHSSPMVLGCCAVGGRERACMTVPVEQFGCGRRHVANAGHKSLCCGSRPTPNLDRMPLPHTGPAQGKTDE